MGAALDRYRQAGVMVVAHGDLFLEDLRQYRERNLARIGMRGLFPLYADLLAADTSPQEAALSANTFPPA